MVYKTEILFYFLLHYFIV